MFSMVSVVFFGELCVLSGSNSVWFEFVEKI